MKKANLLFFFLVYFHLGWSTNIVDIFNQLPNKFALNLTVEERQQLLEKYNNKTVNIEESKRHPIGKISIMVIDVKNGYMKISTNYGDGGYELCYWNRKNGEKLIVINEYGYATSKFTKAINLLQWGNEFKIIELKSTEIIPFEEINNYLVKNNRTEDDEKLITQLQLFKKENLVFKLPRFGKKIKATYGIDNSSNWRKRLLKQDTVTLKWASLTLEIEK